MAIRTILRYPDPRLQQLARPVEQVDDAIRELVRDMAETMYAAPGIGLAATQVDVHKRVVVVDISEDRSVERPGEIMVRALDAQGAPFTLRAQGLLAVCLQHEIDHLNGKVFVQHLSRLKQSRIRAKLTKQERDAA